MNLKLKNNRFLYISEICAFITKDENGNEGIMACQLNGNWFPFIGADIDCVDSIIPMADEISNRTGMKYEIRYFKVVKQTATEGLGER